MNKIDAILAYFPSITTVIIGVFVLRTISYMEQSESKITWLLLSAILCIIGIMWFYLTMEIRLHGIKDNTTRKE